MAASFAPCAAVAQVLDQDALLQRQHWWDNRDWSWYKSNIPFFESPDTAIDATYYYRWQLITRHLTYGSPASGYTFSEFIDRPFWSGAYGAISCPLGHQFYEVRWLKNRRITEDFAHYWFDTPGAQPRSYSNWYGDAMWAVYQVTGDTGFVRAVYPHMLEQYRGWMAEHWDSTHRMFRWDGMHDGMESNIDSRQTTDEFSGADGYRPTLNSYLWADEQAISRAASLLGDTAAAATFAARAAELKQRIQGELWDPTRQFFFHQFANDEKDGIRAGSLTYQTGPHAGNPHGREEIGFVPWQFSLPDSGYEAAWRFLMDTSYFAAPYGPTTTERHDPLFYVSPVCCWWSGNSWSYATSQTLVAMANLLDDYHQSFVTPADYLELLRTYTRTQRLNGRPYIAESANPFDGSWKGANSFDHSEDYFHSQYINLIITGLVGLRPRSDDTLEVAPLAPADWSYFALDGVAYHGHEVSIIWDRDGSRYHRGAGLTILVDGRRAAHRSSLGRLTTNLGVMPALQPVDRPVNLAVNNDGTAYPRISASYSAPTTPPFTLIDGNYRYDRSPPNRWTSQGSNNATDWLTLDFGIARPVEEVRLYFLDDGAGEPVRAPAEYRLEMWQNGRWVEIPDQQRTPASPEGHRANHVSFPRVETSRVRVVLTPRQDAAVGLTELEAWAHVSLPLAAPTAPSPDLAYNPGGVEFPGATASFTGKSDQVEQINDGRIAFSHYSRNRWTAYGTPNDSDWVAIDFGAARRVGTVSLYLWGDSSGVRAPKRYRVQYWSGDSWRDARVLTQLPAQPETWAVNTVRIAPVTTQKLRVVLVHNRPAASGITELEILGDQ
ncbi:MAG TPA: discoidin domain-containing protein [Gemmatimonadales bacterium]|nr:discoidin domain-containing protein [Gemmatimonadales bacterium]